jgi:hypothetical protein
MKKKYFLLLVLLVIHLADATAQEKPEPYPYDTYGENATKTTVVTTDQNLNKIVTVTVRDKEGNIRQIDTWTNDVKGKWTMESKVISIGGNTICKSIYVMDENNNVTRYEYWAKGYGKDVYVRSTDGNLKSVKDGEAFPEQERLKREIEEGIKRIEEKTKPSVEPTTTACSMIPGSNCGGKLQVFGSYSYLHSSSSGDGESFPLGLHAFLLYSISSHMGIGIDVSFHTKKLYEETLSRLFLLAKVSYIFGNTNNCDRSIIPNLHVLAGLGTEKYGSSTGNGFAFGGGADLSIKLKRNLLLSTVVDYIGIKFPGNQDVNNNLRASLGLVVRLGTGSTSGQNKK